MALVLISHDLGVVAENTDRVCVMYAGRIVEDAPIDTVFEAPAHPYTRGLLAALPELDGPRRALVPIAGVVPGARRTCRRAAASRRAAIAGSTACEIAPPPRDRAGRRTQRGLHPRMTALLEVSDLSRAYEVRRGTLAVRQGRDLACRRRRVVRAAGRPHARAGRRIGLRQDDDRRSSCSGWCRSPPARCGSPARACPRRASPGVAGAAAAHADGLSGSARRARPAAQRRPAGHGAAGDPRPRRHAAERREKALAMMDAVGLAPHHFDRFPHELSGGQRQRIVLARALILDPQLLVCDEPISALDVSIQAQVVNLLLALQQRLGLAYLFISHDLRMIRQVSHEVAVMYLGRIVEQGDPDRLFATPAHPYTQALVSAIPTHARQQEAPAWCCRASRPIRSTGRPAAPSIRAAAMPSRAAASRRRRCACWRTAGAPPAISPNRSPRAPPDAALSRRAPAARHPHHLPGHHLRLLRAASVGRSGDDDPVGRCAARIDQGVPRGLGPRPAAVGAVPRLYLPCPAGRSRQLDARRPAGAPARARARAGDAGDHRCRPSRSSSCIGIPAGIYAALHRNSLGRPPDHDGLGRGLHRAELRAGAGAGAGLLRPARLAALGRQRQARRARSCRS